MSNSKISSLSLSTTPLSGTEVLPIVQSGQTVQVSVSNLTAGRSVSASSITLTGSPVATTSGGTGLTSFTANGVVYASNSSALTTGSAIQFDGTNLSVTGRVSGANLSASTFSSWGSPFTVVGQIGNNSIAGSSVGDARFFCNVYYDGSNYKYVSTGYGSIYEQASGAHYWYTCGTGNAGSTISSNTNTMAVDTGGNLIIAGSSATKASGTTWANPSDTRLKNNQQLYQKGLSELLKIQVKTWTYNGLGGSVQGLNSVGVIADEIESILPESVDTYSAKLNLDDEQNSDIKRFNASEVIWLAVKAIQELSAEVDELKSKLKAANISGF